MRLPRPRANVATIATVSRAEGRPITTISVRDAIAPDQEAVLALNNGATPHVNALSGDALAWLIARAAYFRVAEDPTGLAGFVMALPPGLDYRSLDYRWFSDRGGAFLYVDRVVVAERSRRSGVGRALYGDLERFAAGRWPCITLEVDLRPPNPGRWRSTSGWASRKSGFARRTAGRRPSPVGTAHRFCFGG